jgi:acyl-CoA thioester hydrolase
MTSETWDRKLPFVLPIVVTVADIDRLGHSNNTAYLRWMELASWAHIEPLGMPWSAHEESGKAMAIVRTEIDYLGSSYSGDSLLIATWITACDGRLTSERRFQIVREATGKTLVRAMCRYACIDMRNGKPSRMPSTFITAHQRAMQGWQVDTAD